MHPHANCPHCQGEYEVTFDGLVKWFVEHGWRESWQDVVARLLREYEVRKK